MQAIKHGSPDELQALLDEHPGLAAERLVGGSPCRLGRAHAAARRHRLAGARPRARARRSPRWRRRAPTSTRAPSGGERPETPLHWAASSRRRRGARRAAGRRRRHRRARRGHRRWDAARRRGRLRRSGAAARRLVERGARVNLWNAAALGLMDRLEADVRGRRAAAGRRGRPTPSGAPATAASGPPPSICWTRGADRDWIGHDGLAPLDAARRSGASELAEWLVAQGARTAAQARGD